MTQIQDEIKRARREHEQGAPVDLAKTDLSRLESYLNEGERVCITAGKRTPFAAAKGTRSAPPVFLDSNALEMASFTVRELMASAGLEPRDIDKFGFATVLPERGITAFASVLETEVGLRDSRNPNQGLAVDQRANCITSLVLAQRAIESMILQGKKVAIVGGVEKMSTAMLVVDKDLEKLVIDSKQKPGFKWRQHLSEVPRRTPFQMQQVENFITGFSMGQHCEMMAQQHGITALEQAEFSVGSHRKAAAAEAKGYLAQEIAPFKGIERDTSIRYDANVASIMKLRPSFPTPGVETPTINAGTSSAPTDGAAAVVLMTESEAARRNAPPLAFIVGIEEAKVTSYVADGLLMAPAEAIQRLMKRHGLKVSDIDVFELHEPFAAQFLCIDKVVGPIPREKVNPNGGAIAIGHPFAASGARYLHSVANEVHRRSLELKRSVTALIAVCANEGEGIAMLLKSPEPAV